MPAVVSTQASATLIAGSFLLQMTDALEGQRRLHDAKQLPFLILDGLLVKSGVVVMMVPMMAMVMHDHYNLALRRIGHCKAE